MSEPPSDVEMEVEEDEEDEEVKHESNDINLRICFPDQVHSSMPAMPPNASHSVPSSHLLQVPNIFKKRGVLATEEEVRRIAAGVTKFLEEGMTSADDIIPVDMGDFTVVIVPRLKGKGKDWYAAHDGKIFRSYKTLGMYMCDECM